MPDKWLERARLSLVSAEMLLSLPDFKLPLSSPLLLFLLSFFFLFFLLLGRLGNRNIFLYPFWHRRMAFRQFRRQRLGVSTLVHLRFFVRGEIGAGKVLIFSLPAVQQKP